MVTNIFRAVIDHECLREALTPLQEIDIQFLKQPYHSHWSFTPAHKQQILGLIGLGKSEGQQTYVLMLSKADTDCFSNRKTGMARRRVQYGVVDASDADVGAGAPGFRATWQSKALLKLSVDTAANLFSAQKKIASAFYRFRLIIVPNSLSDYILHILDPSLSSEMINNTILNASGAAVEFADIDGTALQFVTETVSQASICLAC
ncbi:TPA: hypothetical protein ACH3X2_000353 [Trebouxia sp. C0005]